MCLLYIKSFPLANQPEDFTVEHLKETKCVFYHSSEAFLVLLFFNKKQVYTTKYGHIWRYLVNESVVNIAERNSTNRNRYSELLDGELQKLQTTHLQGDTLLYHIKVNNFFYFAVLWRNTCASMAWWLQLFAAQLSMHLINIFYLIMFG